ncbi:DNA-processing protein DprA [Alkalibacillus silvisoli]|uniref:DNA-processing protein DprA n=1 Tax=Alkalibacillus silvisoli TaxID=392823 RepID=A0ABN0ZWB8_9BACI
MSVKHSFILYVLKQIKGLKRRSIFHYLDQYGDFEYLLHASPNEIPQLIHTSMEDSQTIYSLLRNDSKKRILWQQFNNSKLFTWFDDHYPQSFRMIPDPPLILYYQGDLSLLKTNMISVIGTRTPSKKANEKVQHLLEPLIENSFTIVSGLAKGVDGMSHQYALDCGGKTIAILGFGFNHVYPSSNQALFKSIAQYGLLLSEHDPQTKPQKWHFPERNRLISGLSYATLIIEASEKSGTIITADQALEQGKEVFVIPDSIFLTQAKGCHKLLKEGATPVTNGEEIIFSLASTVIQA